MKVKYIFSSRRTGRIIGGNQHKEAYPKIVRDVIETSDIILEILDARFVEKTRNRDIERLIISKGKILVYVLNKSDLVDMRKLKEEAQILKLEPCVMFSARDRVGGRKLRDRIKMEAKKIKGFQRVRVGIIGYPNTGKSSIINLLAGRSVAGTSAQSGFTKGIQKIRLTKDILLLDTPGVIPDDEATNMGINRMSLKKQAEIGVKNYDRVKEPEMIVHILMQEYAGVFEDYYGFETEGDSEALLEGLGRKNNFLKKGAVVDTDRTARWILRDWQEGKIRIRK